MSHWNSFGKYFFSAPIFKCFAFQALLKGSRRRKSRRFHATRSLYSSEVCETRVLLSSITVNSAADNLTSGDGLTTLREAIIAANNDTATDSGDTGSGADTITFDASLNGTDIVLSLAGINENAAATGDLDITTVINITGNGADQTVIDANSIDRVFEVRSSGNLMLDGLTITGGNTTVSGGGIENRGTLTIGNSTISGNTQIMQVVSIPIMVR